MAGEIIFETSRLRIREYLFSDLNAIHEYASKAEVVQYQNWGPNRLEDSRQFLAEVMNWPKQNPRMSYGFCIASKPDNHCMGGCGIYLNKEGLDKAKIGYILNPKFWKQGYTTEATQELARYASEELKIGLVEATCDVRNIASKRVLEKSGFELDRLLEKHYLQKGIMRDSYLYRYLGSAST
ncbi:MAG: GNAT family protein [Bacteroidia bacterium]|nr:GNAT family protein [Bacteroidia bacterium]